MNSDMSSNSKCETNGKSEYCVKQTIKVSIIIPVFNEQKTVIEILEKVNRQIVSGIEFEVIIVDDCSQDRTAELLVAHPRLYSKLLKMPVNSGKGAAVREGLRNATGEYILFQDADLEYDPQDYVSLLHPIVEFSADVVMGSRFLAPPYTRVAYFWHKMGNKFITFIFNILNNTTFTDIYTCYLVYRKSLLRADELRTDGWEQQAEILSLAVSRGRVFYEVPISYYGRSYEEGKKIRAYHSFSVLKALFFTRFRRRKINRK